MDGETDTTVDFTVLGKASPFNSLRIRTAGLGRRQVVTRNFTGKSQDSPRFRLRYSACRLAQSVSSFRSS